MIGNLPAVVHFVQDAIIVRIFAKERSTATSHSNVTAMRVKY
jgi:hypothetical protein